MMIFMKRFFCQKVCLGSFFLFVSLFNLGSLASEKSPMSDLKEEESLPESINWGEVATTLHAGMQGLAPIRDAKMAEEFMNSPEAKELPRALNECLNYDELMKISFRDRNMFFLYANFLLFELKNLARHKMYGCQALQKFDEEYRQRLEEIDLNTDTPRAYLMGLKLTYNGDANVLGEEAAWASLYFCLAGIEAQLKEEAVVSKEKGWEEKKKKALQDMEKLRAFSSKVPGGIPSSFQEYMKSIDKRAKEL